MTLGLRNTYGFGLSLNRLRVSCGAVVQLNEMDMVNAPVSAIDLEDLQLS